MGVGGICPTDPLSEKRRASTGRKTLRGKEAAFVPLTVSYAAPKAAVRRKERHHDQDRTL